MSYVKQYKLSPSLRHKVYSLLSQYEPSDILFSVGAGIVDKLNKCELAIATASAKDRARLRAHINFYSKSIKKILQTSKTLKLMEYDHGK